MVYDIYIYTYIYQLDNCSRSIDLPQTLGILVVEYLDWQNGAPPYSSPGKQDLKLEFEPMNINVGICCVCIYINTYTCTYMYNIYIYTYQIIHTYIYIRCTIYLNVYNYTYIYIYIYIYAFYKIYKTSDTKTSATK